MARRKSSKIKSSIYSCVYWNKRSNKWYAQMNHNKKYFYLGMFENEEDANVAVIKKKKELGLINFIPNIEGEVWKPVRHYERKYMVSNKGRIKSLNYKTLGIEKLLSLNKNRSHGYYTASNLGYVHRIVISSFYGESGLIINHKDGDRRNNNLENLEYVTYRENLCHRYLQIKDKIGGSWDEKIRKWRSKIYVNEEYLELGCFDSEEDAHREYIKACIAHGIINRYVNKKYI